MFRFAAASSKPSTLAQTVIRLGAVAAACSALTWSLSGCGGGSRAKEYVPDSVVSFGDENSAMEDYTSLTDPSTSTAKKVQGLVYTVNAVVNNLTLNLVTYCTNQTQNALCNSADASSTPLTGTITNFDMGSNTTHGYYFQSENTAAGGSNLVTFIELGTGQVDGAAAQALKRTYNMFYACSTSRLWNQVVAHSFTKGFKSQCDLDWDGANSYAAHGDKVADMSTKISTHMAELHDGVLVTIMIGQNDIKEIYDRVQGTASPALSDSQALLELDARGATAANLIKTVLATGAKVVLALTPDLGQSPLASANGQNASLLTAYTARFNDALKFGMGNVAAQDGRHFALVESDLFTNPITRSVSYVYNTAVCDMAATFKRPDGTSVLNTDADYAKRLKYCNGNTLVTNGNVSTYMWADDIHFAPAGHGLIGSLAASRVANQF